MVNQLKLKEYFESLRLSRETIAIIIAGISLLVSAVGFYTSSLKPPDISFITAPYIKHVVDDASLNEAFYIPLTIINRGAWSGTVLSFEIRVINHTTQEERAYYGQYFTRANSQTELGDFFTPITLNGYSSAAYTVCFYPLGTMAGNLFSQEGEYEFVVRAKVSNVKGELPITTEDTFRITVDRSMENVMKGQVHGEYPYSLPIESIP